MNKFRLLKANEIECRPQSVKDGKVTLLLYIDSRAATDLLDETYGMENWTIEYKDVAGQIYGRLSVYDVETNRWVYREDTGSPANIEKEKSLASDIIKRCIVRLGVTELYSTPKIQIEDDKYGNTGYKVSEIEYDTNRNIIHLVLVNRFGKEIYKWNKNEISQPNNKPQIQQTNKDLEWKDETKDNLTVLTEYCRERTEAGEDREELGKFFRYWSKKEFKGQMNVEKLWNLWKQKAA